MIGKEKIASIVLTSLLVLSVSLAFTPLALAYDYPPLPLLAVKVPMVGQVDVWLMGEGGTELDPFWDPCGLDIYMNFDPSELEVTNVLIDPQGWYESFWPGGIAVFLLEIDNINGLVRVAFLGLPGEGGFHIPPNGIGRLIQLETTAWSEFSGLELLNPVPRPKIEPWGIEFFNVDIAGFPHPERWMAPWLELKKSPPLPHVVTRSQVVATFTESTHTPKPSEVIYFDASGSYSDSPIVSYEWDFNSDGVVDATGVTASTYYTQFGFYVVTLKVKDTAGLTATASAIKMVNALQNAEAEHRIFKVLSDEDGLNTLTVTVRNFGSTSARVKAIFTTIEKESGAELGAKESSDVTVMTGTRAYLSIDWNPGDYGWSAGTVRYDVRVELSFFDGQAWVTGETFKLGFRATD